MSGFRLSQIAPTWGDVRRLLEVLEAQGTGQALKVRRDLAVHATRILEEDGKQSPDWLPPATETTPAIRAFEELEAATVAGKAEVRRLERQLEAAEADLAKLRRTRCERTVDRAVHRGFVQRHDRDRLVRELEAGDENMRCQLDEFYAPPMPSDEEFARSFEAEFGEAPAEGPAPRHEPDEEAIAIAREFGLRPEEVV